MRVQKKRAVIVCPGRGSYNKSELGYIGKRYNGHTFLNTYDQYFSDNNLEYNLSILDGKDTFSRKQHYHSTYSAGLIHCASYLDALSIINREKYDIVAVTGNSMGWYIACHIAGVLRDNDAINVIQSMANLTDNPIGGQLIYPVIHQDWTLNHKIIDEINNYVLNIPDLYISIKYGGYFVLAGTKAALKAVSTKLEPNDIYPLLLPGNSAFHTPIMNECSEKAMNTLERNIFHPPKIDLIDGSGKIWKKYLSNPEMLYHYTLSNQVTQTYSFTKAIQVAYKEYAPDLFLLTGPGNATGGATAQSLIQLNNPAFSNKDEFKNAQDKSPFIISMGDDTQRAILN